MSITPYQCRAARGLFAMTKQELADASGVSLRTITSFEDATDRIPIAANIAAIRRAFERLGVLFVDGGVEWLSPFSPAQARVFQSLQVRNGASMCLPSDLYAESGCSRGELEALTALRLVTNIDTFPVLTAMGLHVPGLLRGYDLQQERRAAAREALASPLNYSVHPEEGTIFHARTAASYRIQPDGTATVLWQELVPEDQREILLAGAQEALRLHRERDLHHLGNFQWARG